MKTLSAAFLEHIEGARTSLVTCLLMVRVDGLVFGFHTYDEPLTYNGVVYEPAASFDPTDIAVANQMDVDNLTIEGVLSSDSITEDDLRAGRWDYAEFRLFQLNWSDLSMGEKKDRKGTLGQVVLGRQMFTAELLGMMQAYTTSIGEITSPGCRANLGDARCQVDLQFGGSPSVGSPPTTAFTVTGTVDAAPNFYTLTDAARVEPDGYFNNGVITFLDGQLEGLAFEVKTYTIGSWTVFVPLPYDAAGRAYTMHAGCDKRFDTCRDRFNNTVNFRGENWLRGPDALVQVGRHST